MRVSVSFTANNQSSLIAEIRKTRREINNYLSTLMAYGTFGSGTLALYLSPDGGTTKIALTTTPGGTGVSFTANGMLTLVSGHPSNNNQTLQIWGTLTGATSPNITVTNDDNNQ